MTGTVIFLNGTSSSGKTSVLRALQDALEPPFLEMGVDRFILMLPSRYVRPPLWDDVLGKATWAGATGRSLIAGMHHAIAAAARTGNNIIADHVLIDPEWVTECARLFAEMPAYLIGLRCPLDIVEQREQARANRTPGQAGAQFDFVHRYATYDLELDTSVLTPAECAQQVIQRLCSQPTAFKSMIPE